MASATERRCKAQDRRGEPCAAKVVNADGLCAMHAGTTDPRELGRKGGKARRGGLVAQLPDIERESLRDRLRTRLDPEKVQAAIEQSLGGGNESARVAAVRFLADLADLEIYRKDGEARERARGETGR
jgi:hypothetical protein